MSSIAPSHGAAFLSRVRRFPVWQRDLVSAVGIFIAGRIALFVVRLTDWRPGYPGTYDLTIWATAIVVATRRVLPRTTWIVTILAYPLLFDSPVSFEVQILPIAVACYGATRAARVPLLLTAFGGVASAALIHLWGGLFSWPSLERFLNHMSMYEFTEQMTWISRPNYSRIALALSIILAFTVLGWVAHRLGAQRLQLEEQNRQLEQMRDAQAHQAVLAERTRIARDLHDIVAHHVSAMVVRAQAASRVGRDDPHVALDTVDWIADAGKEALTAMRDTVRVLQVDDSAPHSPAAGIRELEASIERVRGSGLRIDTQIDPDLPELSLTSSTALVRIAQEALTNVLLHSLAGRAHVAIQRDDAGRAVVLDVRDAGPRHGAEDTRDGNGVRNMTERAKLAGGDLRAGPDDDGWRVTAWLPSR